MPGPVTNRINAALQAALRLPDVVDRLDQLGLTSSPNSADDMTRKLADDKAIWGPPIKASGFQAD
jgi:tripartite-type tricarboxylate transporter receptor subunit TctC